MPSSKKIIDWSFCLKRAGNSADSAEQLLKIYIKELPLATKEIVRAYRKKDWFTLEEVNHRLLGGCYFCGVPQLKATIKRIEKNLRSRKIDTLAPLIEKIQRNVQEVVTLYDSQQYHDEK